MQINAFLLDSPVNNDPDRRETDPVHMSRHPLVTALSAVLFLEAAAIAAATIYLVIEILVAPADNAISAIALAATAAIAAVWVTVIAVNVLRGNAWVRGASVVVQVLIGAIAIGSFQGIGAEPTVGVILLAPVLVVLVLLFSRPVVLATSKREN